MKNLFCARFSQKGESVIFSVKMKFAVLRLPIFASSAFAISRNGILSQCTAQIEGLFMLSEDSLKFAANCSVAKIFTRAVSGERLMFLRPTEETYDVISSAHKDQIAEYKWSAFQAAEVEDVAKNEHKGAEIREE